MSVKVVVGCQWGDEGKGKIVDVYTEEADIVARYQGGANAGHTVVVGDNKFVLHLIPSGIIHNNKDKKSVIGPGVVLEPKGLMNEFRYLADKNISIEDRLFIDGRTHLILPYHRVLDVAQEIVKKRDGKEIGTTARGIGPSYTDKIIRTGLRVMDLVDSSSFEMKLHSRIEQVNRHLYNIGLNGFNINEILSKISKEEFRSNQALIDNGLNKELLDYTRYGTNEGLKTKPILEDLLRTGNKLKDYVIDTSILINRSIEEGKNVLFEGAQGTFLDINYGTYPYVTSSSTIAGGACTGLGVGPTKINEVVGVVKAYTTRVGEGPFPTEFKDNLIDKIREQGAEFGASTGRPRRCGYFDAVMARTAAYINGLTGIAITKLDVLTGISPLKICTAYNVDGIVHKTFPLDLDSLEKAEPIYEEMDGWNKDISTTRKFNDLPDNAKIYVTRIRQLMREAPGGNYISLKDISVGQKRSEIIRM